MHVNMAAIFSDRYVPVEDLLEKKGAVYKDNPAVDVPILRDRLHYSFIWDRYPLIGLEDINLKNFGEKQDLIADDIIKFKGLDLRN